MRLVDADNARECFGGDGVTGAVMQRMFDSLPTIDAVPVVRCRECKFYRELRTKRHNQLMRLCYRMGKHDMEYPVKPDDFCSYGQRKEDNLDEAIEKYLKIKAGHIGRDHRRCPMKSPECVCKTSEEYIRVALALETLAYHDKNYLDSTFAKSNAAISEEIQACLQKALTMMEEKQ